MTDINEAIDCARTALLGPGGYQREAIRAIMETLRSRVESAVRAAMPAAAAMPLDEGSLRAMRSTVRESEECERQHWWVLFAREIETHHGIRATPPAKQGEPA